MFDSYFSALLRPLLLVIPHWAGRLRRRLLLSHLRARGADIQPCLQIRGNIVEHAADRFKCGRQGWFEDGVKVDIGEKSGRRGQVTIGDFFYCNRYSIINACLEITIGDRVQVGPYVYIGDFDHDVVSRPDRPMHRPIADAAPIRIEDEVWIGAHAVILKGVRVGKAAVIAAGSVVTRDVPAGALVAGVPARLVGSPIAGPDEKERQA